MNARAREVLTVGGWILSAVLAAFTVGFTMRRDWAELPARVTAIEHWRASSVEPALRYLVCSQQASNSGQDPARCDVLLKDFTELLGLNKAAQ